MVNIEQRLEQVIYKLLHHFLQEVKTVTTRTIHTPSQAHFSVQYSGEENFCDKFLAQ